jgi:hypothetical protein
MFRVCFAVFAFSACSAPQILSLSYMVQSVHILCDESKQSLASETIPGQLRFTRSDGWVGDGVKTQIVFQLG